MESNMPKDMNGVSVQMFGMDSAQTIDGTSASAATAAVIDADNEVACELNAIGDVWVTWAATPTAVAEAANNIYIPDGGSKWYPIPAAMKIAVKGGKLNIVKAK